MRPLDPAELSRRQPVWLAFSEFWLDTELTEADLARIAEVARASGYPRDELRMIYLHEVAPVVAANVWSVAGVWDGFDPEALFARCRERAENPSRWRRGWARLAHSYRVHATEQHWRRVCELLAAEPA